MPPPAVPSSTGCEQRSEGKRNHFPQPSGMEIDHWMSHSLDATLQCVWQHNHGGVTASPLPTALGPHPSTPATSRRRLAAIFARSIISHPFRPPPPPATQHAASDDHDDDVCVPGHGEDCPVRLCRAPQPASHRPAPLRHRHLDAAVSRHRVCFLSFALGALHRDGQAEIRLELIPVHIG